MFFDDVWSSTDKYNKVLRADIVFCWRAGYDSTPSSQSEACQIFGNSYFTSTRHHLHWLDTKLLDVSPKLNLAFRPSFDGLHRIEPCVCQGSDRSKSSRAADATKSARRLIVGCRDLDRSFTGSATKITQTSDEILNHRHKKVDSILPALAPGLYVVAADISESNAMGMNNRSKTGGDVKERDLPRKPLFTLSIRTYLGKQRHIRRSGPNPFPRMCAPLS